MIIQFDIYGNSPETRDYVPTTFYLNTDSKRIISGNAVLGTMLREDITETDLYNHCDRMRESGFTITISSL